MIFLAVTLGFFAENLREHFNDNHEIKSDMQSMIADLQSDVDMYNSTIAVNDLGDRRIDTLIKLLKIAPSNTSDIYFFARDVTANNIDYLPNEKTFEQMKNSSALRLIESKAILDSISSYYQSIEFFKSQNILQDQKVDDIHLVNSLLFDGYIFQEMYSKVEGNSGLNVIITKPLNNPPLLTTDYTTINKVIVAYHYLYATTEVNTEAAEVYKQQAGRLIDLLKKEYNLK
ncbi:MAG: hypothetical protein JO072_13960 [Parafilimonas sp.]|nr:hypothetical protein [Parafilimonas sp.]